MNYPTLISKLPNQLDEFALEPLIIQGALPGTLRDIITGYLKPKGYPYKVIRSVVSLCKELKLVEERNQTHPFIQELAQPNMVLLLESIDQPYGYLDELQYIQTFLTKKRLTSIDASHCRIIALAKNANNFKHLGINILEAY